MSTINDKIKLLQRKLATVERLNQVLSYVEGLGDPTDHPGLSKELSSVFKTFVETQISNLEAGSDLQPETVKVQPQQFSDEEVTILRSLIERVKTQSTGTQPPKTVTPSPQSDRSDKIRFAMQNRHLDQKRVAIQTKDGTVKGKVVGLDAPHVIVQTDTGYTVPVELEQVTVIS